MFCFRYLAVAASLTGGNALAAFIKMIQVSDKFLGAYPDYFIFNQVFKIDLLSLASLESASNCSKFSNKLMIQDCLA